MGKTVFITGTTRGIGKAAVKVFAENGWDAVAHARVRTDGFEDCLAELAQACKVSITPVYFDMTDTQAMKDCVKDLKKAKITIDSLVNNAGVAHGGLFQMTPVSAIRDIFDINLFAHMELTQLVLRIMAKEGASIVNVASTSGIDMRSGNSAYGVSKAAMIAWTKVLQAELKGAVRVNAVAPGPTDTDMTYQMDDKLRAAILSHSAMGRLAEPEEAARVIYFLASDDASFIAGQILKVDGGGGLVE